MNTKIKLVSIIVALLLVGGGYYVYDQQKNQAQAPTTDTGQEIVNNNSANSTMPTNNANTAPVQTNLNANTNAPVNGVFSGEPNLDGPDVQVTEVWYDGSTFKPASVTVKARDIVVFKNMSDGAFWPASNPHPTHTLYPEFDARKGIAGGQNYQFKFTKVGTWGYHDHLHNTITGTVVVTN